MKKIRILIILLCIFSLLLFTGCSSFKNSDAEYKYGVIFSASNNSKSTVYTYDNTGKYVSSKSIDAGGITMASFMKFGESTGDYVYYACPISENKPNKYLLQLNTNNLESKKIKSTDNITPTHFSIDDKFAYSGSSSITTTYISKTDLYENSILNSTEIEGQGIFMLEDTKNLYVIGIIHNTKTYGKIHVLDKTNFKISSTVDLPNLSFITDAKIINNNMYILSNRDGNDNLTNQIIELNLNNFSTKIVELPFNNLFNLHYYDNYMYVVEHSYHNDKTNNRIAKINLNTMEVNVFSSKNDNKTSYINENRFISSDGEKIYIYDTKNFSLINQFDIKKAKDQFFVSFYIKE
ncbi:hypothetical protein [Clostridium tunisiense]|uniref:hypothetical protein n=1 Tax=Clostridium tunisiense TaxID=219748 RepID=UPI00031DA636|nr:hypothetical protein [Clostridium tunisiense]